MKLLKRIILLTLLLVMLASGIFVGIGFLNYKKTTAQLPVEEKVAELQSDENYVSNKDISPYLLKATIAIEDRRFYDHSGIDYFAMVRAFLSNVFAQEIVVGGSTITQQLAKNMYYTYQPSYIRKMSEVFTAYELENKLTKDTILELYVNIINYGDNHIGIRAASLGYFGKEPKDLTLDEASLLAGLPQSPNNYQLSNHKENARKRQKQVLQAMVRDGYIMETEAEELLE